MGMSDSYDFYFLFFILSVSCLCLYLGSLLQSNAINSYADKKKNCGTGAGLHRRCWP